VIAFRHEPAYAAISYQLCEVQGCVKVAVHQIHGRALCGHHRDLLAAELAAKAKKKESAA